MTANSLIRITSWNVAHQNPSSGPMLDRLFDDSKRVPNIKPDIQIVGLQEAPSYMFNDPWTDNLSSTLQQRGYILFKHHKLSGILLYIFVLREMLLRTRDFETESVRTGFGGLMGNKGGVSLRFNYNGNSFSITNSHLAAHLENLPDRINDYKSIITNTKFLLDPKTPTILDHDYTFWLGDLNFRLENVSTERVLKVISEYISATSDDEKAQIISSLYKYDQLINVKDKGLAFANFTESLPKFLPTYKFQIGTRDQYDSEKRIPAWTDRILFRKSSSNVTKQEQLLYDSIPDMEISDHKPVISMFKVTTNDPADVEASTMPYEVVKFLPITGWRERQDGRLWYKISDELFYREPKVLSSWDRLALYPVNFNSVEKFSVFVYPSQHAKIAPRPDAPDVPYLTPVSSRSGSPSVSRQLSEISITQATEAISLNASESSTPPNATSSDTSTRPRSRVNEPIVEDGYKYFSAIFPDESMIPGTYVVMYLKTTDANEYNIYGISESFNVSSL